LNDMIPGESDLIRHRQNDNRKRISKKKKRRRRMIQKLIPFLVVFFLIIIVLAVALSTGLLEKYSYSTQKADLNEYFSVYDDTDVAIITSNVLTTDKAKLYDGTCYLDYDLVSSKLFDRFYLDPDSDSLLYTTATDIVRIPMGSTSYYIGETPTDVGYVLVRRENDTIYIALDYLKNYVAFTYHLYEGTPYHMDLDLEWPAYKTAKVKKKSNVRLLGGIKSEILTNVAKEETVVVLEEMEEWSKVKTDDGFIGYLENKLLIDYGEETPTPPAAIAEEIYPNIHKDYPINLAWHQVTNATANSYLEEVLEGTSGITTISPTWYFLSDNAGNFTTCADHDYVNTAHSMGLEVWALVDDFTNSVDTFEIFSHAATRQTLITNLIASAKEYNIDGLNIDFEKITADAGPHYVQFLRELSIQCRANNLVLSVDNYVPREYTSHYNRKEQGRVADYVIIMGYDEHYAGSEESGSVASIGFVKEGIEETLKVVPKEKVINALPFYTRIWTETPKTAEDSDSENAVNEASGEYIPYTVTSDAQSMQGALDFVKSAGCTPTWDETTQQNYAEFVKDGVTYKVWLEDDASITAKMQAIQSYQIAGVAGWKLGLQTNSVWNIISQYLN